VFEVVNNLLRKCVQPTHTMISNLVKIELSYINTSHPDFIGGRYVICCHPMQVIGVLKGLCVVDGNTNIT
jgi:hypothetical protein